jgi:hypothetical protein
MASKEKKLKLSKALTWEQVAKHYNKLFSGRRAMTLPMNTVFDKLSSHKDFHVDEKEGTIHKIKS